MAGKGNRKAGSAGAVPQSGPTLNRFGQLVNADGSVIPTPESRAAFQLREGLYNRRQEQYDAELESLSRQMNKLMPQEFVFGVKRSDDLGKVRDLIASLPASERGDIDGIVRRLNQRVYRKSEQIDKSFVERAIKYDALKRQARSIVNKANRYQEAQRARRRQFTNERTTSGR